MLRCNGQGMWQDMGWFAEIYEPLPDEDWGGYRPFHEEIARSGILYEPDPNDIEGRATPERYYIQPPPELEQAVDRLLMERAADDITPEWFENVAYLARRGYRSPAFNALLADVILGQVKRARARPKSRINAESTGRSYRFLKDKLQRATGLTGLDLRAALAEKLNVSTRTVDKYLAAAPKDWPKRRT